MTKHPSSRKTKKTSFKTAPTTPEKTKDNGSTSAKVQGEPADIFTHAPPEGHARTVSAVLGEIVWLMSQSPIHKQFFIADLDWFVMTPVLLGQFRLFYAQNKPVGVVLWAKVNDDIEARLAAGTTKLRPQDWKCGEKLWVVEVISPFGGPEEMVANFKAHVFPDREVRYVTVSSDGTPQVKIV